MGTRIEATTATVADFLEKRMTRENYHLLYGLQLLPKDSYLAVLDALLNNELQIEDLVRLGGFTAEEATKLLKETLGAWTNTSVSLPAVGLDGYTYLTEELGLQYLLEQATETPLFTTSELIAAYIKIGGANGHRNEAEVEKIFREYILPSALAGLTLPVYLPGSESEFKTLPCPNNDIDRHNQMWLWGSGIYDELLNPDDGLLLRRLITVGSIESVFRRMPSLAGWVAESSRPSLDTHLRIHREAGSRSIDGKFTDANILALITECENATPTVIGTSNSLSELDFNVALIGGYLTVNPNPALLARYLVLKDALQGIYDHRDKLRGFMSRIITGCMAYLLGVYPH